MEPKKISFGFSKITKSNILTKKPAPVEENKVQLIEYLEGQSIKVVGGQDDKPKELLVIPMKAPNKKLINLVDIVQNNFVDKEEELIIKAEQNNSAENGNKEVEAKPLSLDELAAKELLNDLKKTEPKEESQRIIEVDKEKVNLEGEKESTIEDYESIPVEDFGKAMLRGMGWKDGTGIGKNQQLVKMAQPPLRPKGMGLGADKLTKQDSNVKPAVDRDGKVLSCVKGAYIKVIAGYHKGSYGQIIGFDDESGRFIIKTALNNLNISLNEFLVIPVTKEDYNKNSKVINNAKYDEYIKKKEAEKEIALKMEAQQSVKKIEKEHDSSSSEKEIRHNKKEDKRDLNVQDKPRTKKEYQEEGKTNKRNMSSEDEGERRKNRRDDKKRLKTDIKIDEKRRNNREYEVERNKSTRRDVASDEENERKRHKREDKSRSKSDNKTEVKRRNKNEYLEEKRPSKRNLSSEDDKQNKKREKSRKYSESETESSDGRYRRKVKKEELSDEEYSRSRKKDKSSSKRSTKYDSEEEENKKRDKIREKKKHQTSSASDSDDSEEERHRKKKSKKKHKKSKKRSSEDSAEERHRRKKKETKYSSDSEPERKKRKRKKEERDKR